MAVPTPRRRVILVRGNAGASAAAPTESKIPETPKEAPARTLDVQKRLTRGSLSESKGENATEVALAPQAADAGTASSEKASASNDSDERAVEKKTRVSAPRSNQQGGPHHRVQITRSLSRALAGLK